MWGGSSARIERPPVTRKVAGSSPVHPARLRSAHPELVEGRLAGQFFAKAEFILSLSKGLAGNVLKITKRLTFMG